MSSIPVESDPTLSPAQPINVIPIVLLASFAASYWGNFIWFHLESRWGASPSLNLMLNAGWGAFYVGGCISAMRAARSISSRTMLIWAYMAIIALVVLCGASPMFVGVAIAMMGVSVALTWTWPNLQLLMAFGRGEHELGRAVGYYNLAWAATTAVTLPMAGFLYAWKPSTLFTIPTVVFIATLGYVMLKIRPTTSDADPTSESIVERSDEGQLVVPEDAEPIIFPSPAGAAVAVLDPPSEEGFLRLARRMKHLSLLGNLACYLALSTFLPILPFVLSRIELTGSIGTLFGSIWLVSRVGTFWLLGRWRGWQFNPRLFYLCMLALPLQIWILIMRSELWLHALAQVGLGFSLGLIYSSSLFYSLHSKAEASRGAIHEAVLGIGVMIGPLAAAAAARMGRANGIDPTDAIGIAVTGLLLLIAAAMLVFGFGLLMEKPHRTPARV